MIERVAWLLFLGWLAGLVHELAHAVAASACGLRVQRVTVGVGPGVSLRVGKSSGQFLLHLGVLPLAGWCEVSGLREAPPPARALVYMAGGVANLVVAIVLASLGRRDGVIWDMAVVSFALSMVSLAPLPSFDGWWVLSALLSAAAGPQGESRAQAVLAALAVSQAALLLVAGTVAVTSASWPGRESTAPVAVAGYLLAAAVFAGVFAIRRRKRAARG